MSDLEKPGKCLVCGSADTCVFIDIEHDVDGKEKDILQAVRCRGCHFEIRSRNLTITSLISIWNRLSLSPVEPVPPAEAVEVLGGAGSGDSKEAAK